MAIRNSDDITRAISKLSVKPTTRDAIEPSSSSIEEQGANSRAKEQLELDFERGFRF